MKLLMTSAHRASLPLCSKTGPCFSHGSVPFWGMLTAALILLYPFNAAFAQSSAIIEATKRGDYILVAEHLNTGIDPNTFDSARNTPLIYAARDGYIDVARLLLANGADINWIDSEGVTPLILAAFKNHANIAKLLLQHGAKTGIRDQWGRTALDYALRRGTEDRIAILLRRHSGN